jgi:large subunit ribosomal protein L24e
MVQTRQCDFCGTDIEPGTGTMFVYTNGQVVHYCSSKCEKNTDLGRVPREVEWTAENQRLRQRRRNVGAQEEVEEVAADAPEEDSGPAEEIDTVPGETEAEAVAAATDVTDDEAVGTDSDEGISEVEGRRAGGTDPDIDEDQDADPDEREDEAEASVENDETIRDTDDEDGQ